MNKKWILAAMSALIVSFSSCKDDKMSQEEMYSELVQNGTDWVLYGLKGKVETMTQSQYSDVSWKEGAVVKGKENYRSITNFSPQGFITGGSYQSLVVVAIEWAKDDDGKDVVVVKSEFKTTGKSTYTLDSKHRETESVNEWINYSAKIGNYGISSWSDTIPLSNLNGVKVGDELVTEQKPSSPSKVTYTYDDANKTVTCTNYSYNESSKSFEITSKTEYPLDENGRIIPLYENEEGRKALDANYNDYKVIANRDDKGNIAEKYQLYTSGNITSINTYSTYTYTYY